MSSSRCWLVLILVFVVGACASAPAMVATTSPVQGTPGPRSSGAPASGAPPAPACAPDDVASCSARCDAGEAASCTRLGEAYEKGINGKPSPERAASAYDAGCKGKDARACEASQRLDSAQSNLRSEE